MLPQTEQNGRKIEASLESRASKDVPEEKAEPLGRQRRRRLEVKEQHRQKDEGTFAWTRFQEEEALWHLPGVLPPRLWEMQELSEHGQVRRKRTFEAGLSLEEMRLHEMRIRRFGFAVFVLVLFLNFAPRERFSS